MVLMLCRIYNTIMKEEKSKYYYDTERNKPFNANTTEELIKEVGKRSCYASYPRKEQSLWRYSK